eukprot:7822027-Alexandrium_andersonii.AAC.1
MPAMTFAAIAAAFENMDREGQSTLRETAIDLCIYVQEHNADYRQALLNALPAEATRQTTQP